LGPSKAILLVAVILLLLTLQSIPSVALTGTLHSPRVKESSGIAASRAHPGVLWTHNDSGDDAYVYATDLAGADRGVVRIRGARAVDWEDIALGPCPTQRAACLYIADTGDNEMTRKSVVIYAMAEPDPPDRPGGPVRASPAAAPRLPCAGGPGGRVVAIRTYSEIYLFVPGEGGRLMPSGRPVCNITGLEVQGEAIDFLDDSTFVLTSEGDRRGRRSIHSVRCPE